MSSSGPSLDFGSGSPEDTLGAVINFFQSGGSVVTLIQGSIFGVVVSVFVGGINIVQSIFGLVAGVLDGFGDVTVGILEGFLVDPLSVLQAGADTSAAAIQDFGILGLLVGTVLILGMFWLITQFLEEEETPDILAPPGFPDIPAIGPLDVGVTEEGEETEDT